jgi:hypothetical protein
MVPSATAIITGTKAYQIVYSWGIIYNLEMFSTPWGNLLVFSTVCNYEYILQTPVKMPESQKA